MDINAEQLTLSPAKENDVNVKGNKSNLIKSTILSLSVLLILASITAHVGIIASGIQYFTEDGNTEKLLLYNILPDFTKKAPAKNNEQKGEDTSMKEKEDENPISDEDDLTSQDLSTKNEHGFSLKNETTYNPDLDVLFNSPNPIEKTDKLYEKYTEDEPIVLIYHTHATESYTDTNDSGAFRSKNPEKNMIAVGNVICSVLQSEGIRALHITKAFDSDDFNSAYNKSSDAVEAIMEIYPSIKYVIDIHRDSITDEDGNNVSADFTYQSLKAAQMMFVVGTDEGGSGHSDWRQNLTTVLHLQDMLSVAAPASVRPINLRKASFYQDKSPGAMLVEIGSSGNTLEEAKRSAVILGCTLAEYITGKKPLVSTEDMLSALDLS